MKQTNPNYISLSLTFRRARIVTCHRTLAVFLALLVGFSLIPFQPTRANAQVESCGGGCNRSFDLQVVNTNNSYAGYQVIQREVLTLSNLTNSTRLVSVPADYLSSAFGNPSPLVSYRLFDSVGRTYNVSTSQTQQGIEYGNPSLQVEVPAEVNYSLVLEFVVSSEVFVHDGPFILEINVNQTSTFPAYLSLKLPGDFTLLAEMPGGSITQNSTGTQIRWFLPAYVTVPLWAKFLPFKSSVTDLASWTSYVLPKETDVRMNMSQVYPSAGIAEISYFMVGDIPQRINGVRFDPNIPVEVPLPGLGEVEKVDSVSDQLGPLLQLFSPPESNSSESIGTFYVDQSTNQIVAYPRPIPTNGYYEYQITARYEAGTKGATSYHPPYSAEGIIWVIPKLSSNVSPYQNSTFYLQVLMPAGTSPNTATTPGYQISSVGGRALLTWQKTVGADFSATRFVVGYQIQDVQGAFVTSLLGLIIALAGFVVATRVRKREVIIPIIFTIAVAIVQYFGSVPYIGVFLDSGPFQLEADGIAILSALFLVGSFAIAIRGGSRRRSGTHGSSKHAINKQPRGSPKH